MDWRYHADDEHLGTQSQNSSLIGHWSQGDAPEIESDDSEDSNLAAPAAAPSVAQRAAADPDGVMSDSSADSDSILGPSAKEKPSDSTSPMKDDDNAASALPKEDVCLSTLLEERDPETVQLERDVLATCNGLRLLAVEEAGSGGSRPRTVFMLTKETLLNLHDVATLIRQNSTLDSDGERKFTIELLLLNPKYALLETALLPVWAACLDTEEETEYLEKLIFIFARVLIPFDKTWKYRHMSHWVQWYQDSIQRVKPLFLRPVFWRGLNHTMHRLNVSMKDKGRVKTEEERREELLRERDLLRSAKQPDAPSADPLSRLRRLEDIEQELAAIDTGRVRRYQALESQMVTLKVLVLCLLRLGSPSDPVYAKSVAGCISSYGLFDLFEAEWRRFVAEDMFPRSRRTHATTAALWRILDFYGRLTYEIPPHELLQADALAKVVQTIDRCNIAIFHGVNAMRGGSHALRLFHQTSESNCRRNSSYAVNTQSTVCELPVFQRHSKFNPVLMKRRLEQKEGEYIHKAKRDKLMRLGARRRRVLKRRDASMLLPPDVYDICLRPLGQGVACEGTSRGSTLYSTETLVSHLLTFIRLGLNGCVGAWITDCIAEDETLDEYDAFKVVNLIAWVLNFKRRRLQLQLQALAKCNTEQVPSSEAENNPRAALNQIVGSVLALRALLDTNGIFFVYRLFHTQVKKQQLRNGSDFLAKLCLRALTEQLLYGILLVQEGTTAAACLPEALKVVGQCVIEDVVKTNVMSDIVWALRMMNPHSHNPDFVLYTFEAAFLLLHALRRLGGSAAVAFQRGRLTDTAPAATKTRRVEINEYLEQLADGRIIKTIIKCLRTFRTNGGAVNRCLARLLIGITRHNTTPQGKYIVGLCFQLSYFDLYSQILHDHAYRARPDSVELVQCVEWIVTQFWAVFEQNKLCVLELLFGKSEEPPTKAFAYSDPNVLVSVFTNYQEGLDHEYLQAFQAQNDVDDEAAAEWRRQREAQLRAKRVEWTPEETRTLLRHWDIKKKLPHALRQVRRSMKSRRPLRELRSHLIKLGVLEFDGEELQGDNDEEDGVTRTTNLPLLSALLAFRDLDVSLDAALPQSQKPFTMTCTLNESSSPHKTFLSHLVEALHEIVLLKRHGEKTRREEFVIDTPYEVPTALLQSSECAQLMQALGASRKELSSIELLTVPPPDASSEPPCCWVVSQRMTADDLSTRVDKLEQYLSLPEDTLERMLRSTGANSESVSPNGNFEHFSKLRIVTALALLKIVETTFDWSSATQQVALQMNAVLTSSDKARSHLMGRDSTPNDASLTDSEIVRRICAQFSTEASRIAELCDLALPEGIALPSLVSAIAAGMDHLARKRKQHLLTYATPITAAERVSLGQLTFPDQPLDSSFGKIVQFIRTSNHPLLHFLLENLGFQHRNDKNSSESQSTMPSDIVAWVLPAAHTLQRIDVDLYHLRGYTLSSLSMLMNVLKRLATIASSVSSSGQRTTAQQNTHRDVPLLVVEDMDSTAARHIAKAVYKLRRCATEACFVEPIVASFHSIMDIVSSWNSRRCLNSSDAAQVDSDLILHATRDDADYGDNADDARSIRQFKDMLEFQHCLLAILGRCDSPSAPTEWYWSRGCSLAVVEKYLSQAKLCFAVSLKVLKKYAKGKIVLEELVGSLEKTATEDIETKQKGAAFRADLTAYSYPHDTELSKATTPDCALQSRSFAENDHEMSCFGSSQNHVRSPPPTDNPCAAQITSSGITLHAPPEPRQDAPPIMVSNDAPVLPRSVLDDEAFFNTLLDEAAEDFKKQATETVREATLQQELQRGISAFLQFSSKHNTAITLLQNKAFN